MFVLLESGPLDPPAALQKLTELNLHSSASSSAFSEVQTTLGGGVITQGHPMSDLGTTSCSDQQAPHALHHSKPQHNSTAVEPYDVVIMSAAHTRVEVAGAGTAGANVSGPSPHYRYLLNASEVLPALERKLQMTPEYNVRLPSFFLCVCAWNLSLSMQWTES